MHAAAAAPPNEKNIMHGAFLHGFSESSDPPGSIRQERDGCEEAEGFRGADKGHRVQPFPRQGLRAQEAQVPGKVSFMVALMCFSIKTCSAERGSHCLSTKGRHNLYNVVLFSCGQRGGFVYITRT